MTAFTKPKISLFRPIKIDRDLLSTSRAITCQSADPRDGQSVQQSLIIKDKIQF